MNDARVMLWGTVIGAVTWVEDREIGIFQYTPDFLQSSIQPSPLMMPLRESTYEFPGLARAAFKGLPGLIADSLPDRYGNKIIDAWLASQGRTAGSFHPVERLCYVGKRGMGALEYQPAILGPKASKDPVEVESLLNLANEILSERKKFSGRLTGSDDKKAIDDILRVGTSAGGVRAKAILAWNEHTNEFRSGQVKAGEGYEYWIMKFDGIKNTGDSEVYNPLGYGKVEYAYHLMAVEAGIEMTKCRLHHEGGRSHFMTKRFDRTDSGKKFHMQSLGAIAHYDYSQPASYSYEQALQVIRRMKLSRRDMEQQVLRAFFNVVSRNCDDHVKNIAFLMNRQGKWKLSPAFDLSFAWNPRGEWTSKHQMSINGKREGFTRDDLISLAAAADIKKAQAEEMIENVIKAVRQWPEYAANAGVEAERIKKIQDCHLLSL